MRDEPLSLFYPASSDAVDIDYRSWQEICYVASLRNAVLITQRDNDR